MTNLSDGTALQDGLRFTPRAGNPGDTVRYVPFPVEGQITKVVAPESDENFDQETYLCDIHVTELGIDLFKVPWMLAKAGPDNYVHYGPVAATANLIVPGELPLPFNSSVLKPKVSNGDTVIVVFLMGDVHRPRIISMAPHNQSGPQGICPDPRPTEEDGDCYKVRFGGTSLMIDQDGNVSIYNTATIDELAIGQVIPTPKTFTVTLTDSLGQESTTLFDGATGSWSYEGSKGTKATFDNENDGFSFETAAGATSLEVSTANGVQIAAPGVTASFKSGAIEFVVTSGFKVNTTATGYEIIADAGDVLIQANAGNVIVDANGGVTVNSATGDVALEGSGGARAKLGSGMVGLGKPGAEVVDFLEQIVTKLSTTTAAGFGAPISSVADFVAMLPGIASIKGGV